MAELELKQLAELAADVKTFIAKGDEQIKNIGALTTETKSALEVMKREMHEKMNAQQAQLDGIDAKMQQKHTPPAAGERKSIGALITESEEYKEAVKVGFSGKRPVRLRFEKSAFAHEQKDITETLLGTATSGVLVQQRLPGVVPMARQALRIRDVMNVVMQETGNSFDYVYQDTRTNAASPQVEGSAKAESNLKWSSASGQIRTIAHFFDVSRQSLADIPWMRGEIDTEAVYGLKVKEESEILAGVGTGEHLNGIITQATAFDTVGLLVAAAGWSRLDILRLAKLQARLAGKANYAPSAFVLHPTDLARVELTKDTNGVYIVGDPKTGAAVKMIWDLPVVESDSITAGTFLVGAFNSAATLIDRQQVSTEISFEHGTNFTLNMATVLCEERIGLAVKVATAFITGSFTTSPATQN